MSIEEYKAAVKKGEKEISAQASRGESPIMPVLDEIIENVNIVGRINLGLITIPTELIVGTATRGRSNSFTKNFMPLLPPDTEFAFKWSALYDSMVEEGMREGIIAYEYMGKYYVQEGNKRVSVSKYTGVPYVEGSVTRYIPEKTDDPENIIYYEFLDFYAKSGINEIYFSKSGSFARFSELVAPGQATWDEDTKMNVRSLYARFKKEYLARGGENKLPLSVSDALLRYVSLMGYADVKDKTPAKIKEDMPKLWQEFELDTQEKPITISTHPTKKTPLRISQIFTFPKNLKIAFMHLGNVDRSSWVYAHELGRHYVDTVFRDSIKTESVFDVTPDRAEEELGRLADEGFDIIFATSPQHLSACAKQALLHPNVKILNCSLNASTKHLRTYFLRTYESKFLLGMIAGSLTRTNHIAYVADNPVYGTVASINAYALGAQTVNPYAEVFLSWTSLKGGDPSRDINDNNCDIVSDIDWSSPKNLTSKFGLYRNGSEPEHLAAPIWDWGKLYETIIKSVQRGSWQLEENALGPQSLGYWWGLSSGSVDIIFSQHVPRLTLRIVEFMKSQIIKGNYHPIDGPLYFQDGSVDEMKEFDILDLINMDKLVKGIHGFIPGVDDVKEESVPLTMVQGVIDSKP